MLKLLGVRSTTFELDGYNAYVFAAKNTRTANTEINDLLKELRSFDLPKRFNIFFGKKNIKN